ncbi:MAG: aminopeptidase P N-terminal domain-containing protein [Planctomycetia bacterium]|nr:aminopeptidase P N-terminal domain-containing protein [Planctomycetia bacterium]
MRHTPIDPGLFTANRRRLVQLLPPGGLAVLHAADILPTTGDGTLRIHPASDLFWASGIEQEESVLVLAPSAVDPGQREMLFLRQPSEHLVTWEGAKLTQEQARQISGIAKIRWLTELPGAMHALLCASNAVYLNANEHERTATEVESRDVRLARQLIHRYPLHRFERLAPLLRQLRAVKTPAEVALIRKAVDITDAGLRRLLAALRPGVMEFELEAELTAEFVRRRGRMAYEPIIASGKSGCVLHYHENEQACRDGELVLVDVGSSYANYASDLTRTYPVNGRFTPRQRAVYEAVLRVLRSSIARTTIGTRLRDWKRAAQVEMTGELVKLGLVTAERAAHDSADEPACKKYFMHGLGHSLGLGVHDMAPVDGPLAAGWVMTVEPGIYIPEEGLAVRLENDVLVTENGPVDLSGHVPIEPDEIERIMAGHAAGGGRV